MFLIAVYMSKQEILQELYDTHFVAGFVRKCNQGMYTNDEIEDIEQEVWLMICSLTEDKLQDLYGQGGINKVRQYCSGIITRQIKSKTSQVYYRYRKNENHLLVGTFENIDEKDTVVL